MGRDYFTFDSNIKICQANIKKLLEFLNYQNTSEKKIAADLIHCLADYDWILKRESKNIYEFRYEDNSDEDFDWDLFESMSIFFEPDSFYEESVDDDMICGAYTTKKTLRKCSYSITQSGKKSLFEKKDNLFKHNKKKSY